MSPLLTLALRPGSRLPARLLGVLLGVLAAAAPGALPAQTTTPQEVSSRDVEPTFKLQSERNLVLVRVVVRDAKGATVENLRKEDFQLFDRGKPQTILHFSLEKPTLKTPPAAVPKAAEKTVEETEGEEEAARPASTASRFVALYFDDVNSNFENLARTRDAADHFLSSSMQPGDRVALYTSSGQEQVEFTDDLGQIRQALFKLRPTPIIPEDHSCGAIPPYEAYLIVEHQDPIAVQVATEEIGNCTPCPAVTAQQQQQCIAQAAGMAQQEAVRALEMSETQSRAALQGIESIVRRMTTLPGQRSMLIVSAGFLTDMFGYELSEIADRALRAGVVINALDARGLYTDNTLDASQAVIAHTSNTQVVGEKIMMLQESQRRQTEGMRSLAVDTGGSFFNNSNDLETGFRRALELPPAYYVLAFSPQNLKSDGAFHPLQVKLVAQKGLAVQARKGYFAPKKPTDLAAQEAEDIREAVFSQDETHALPIDVHTQYFMKTESDARIAVLTRLDLHPLRFRKEVDRNVDKLTFVTAMFDRDGHLVSGQEKTVDLHLRDASLEKLLQTGITIQSTFDVKPGTYLVRAVVRDSESGQISGLNRTVEIPY